MPAEPPFESYFLEDRLIGDGWFVTLTQHPRFGQGWLAFKDPIQTLTAWTVDEVRPILNQVAQSPQAAGFVAYDASLAFDPAFTVQTLPGQPLACFHIYNQPPVFYKELVATQSAPTPDWQPEIDKIQFLAQCARIREHLAAGDTYQVNFSFRLHAQSQTPLAALFASLVSDDPPPYASLFLSEHAQVASLSPELFFELEGGRIRCQPMKGTAPVGPGNAERLRNSEKDRAENLMVVDMIRNDLGRAAEVGSVRTTSLFDVEAFPTVLQMTSTVEAKLNGNVADAFDVLFPCASIVGAPKVSTMGIIRNLETSPRGVYTGAIGFVGPERSARFAVAIRTIAADGPQLSYGAGSGIVWDSDPESEWRETMLKTDALRRQSPEWALFETFRWPDRPELPLVELHLSRLTRSAQEFGIPFDPNTARAKLEDLGDETFRVRLSLRRSGELDLHSDPYHVPTQLEGRLAPEPVCSEDPSLRHKTNRRRIYDRALRLTGADEALLWNERGEATEFCKGNLAVRLSDRLITPPAESGLLPGVLRGHLLCTGQIEEGVVKLEDIISAEIFRINSLTGWVRVHLLDLIR
jgi:para-aminobenzoate synthetase/4-amino-4-deoxychorismate lyase